MLKELIEKWIAENYGKSELDNPSYDIDSLVGYIYNRKKEELWSHIKELERLTTLLNQQTEQFHQGLITITELNNTVDAARCKLSFVSGFNAGAF